MFQRLAIQKFHRDERLLPVPPDLVDRANIRMVQSRRCSSFAPKTFQRLRIFREFGGQEFKGDEAAKFGVLSLVDHAHTPAAEFFDDAVVRDGLADHFWPMRLADAL